MKARNKAIKYECSSDRDPCQLLEAPLIGTTRDFDSEESRHGRRTKKKASDYSLRLNAEEVGFEPTVPCETSVFKTDAIGHSATLPYRQAIYAEIIQLKRFNAIKTAIKSANRSR